MLLCDIAAGYREAERLVQTRIRAIRAASDPGMSGELRHLTQLRRELRKTAEYLENYYLKGEAYVRIQLLASGGRDAGGLSAMDLGAGGGQCGRSFPRTAGAVPGNPNRIDTQAADALADALLRGVKSKRHRASVRIGSLHGKQNPPALPNQALPLCQVCAGMKRKGETK